MHKITAHTHRLQGSKPLILGFALLVFSVHPAAAQFSVADFHQALQTNFTEYCEQVNVLRDQAQAGVTNANAIVYLEKCRTFGQFVLARIVSGADSVQHNEQALDRAVALHKQASKFALDQHLTGTPFVRAERELYGEFVDRPFLSSLWLQKQKARVELFHRKYLADDDPQANYFEGWLQGELSLTRFNDQKPDSWQRCFGVSAWEASFRMEPLIVLGGHQDAGLLLAGGLLFNFFPKIVTQPNNQDIAVQDSWASRWLRRTGPRLGAGVRFAGADRDLLLGGGWQVRCFTIWGVYDTSAHEYTCAVGLSEWGWLQRFLPMGRGE